jgi:hypothetical protein
MIINKSSIDYIWPILALCIMIGIQSIPVIAKTTKTVKPKMNFNELL